MLQTLSAWADVLNSPEMVTWVPVLVMLLLVFVALRALGQIAACQLQSVAQTYDLLFDILLSPEMVQIRRFVTSPGIRCVLKNVDTGCMDGGCLKQKLNEEAKKLQKEFGKLMSFKEIDRLLTAFNHVGLMLQNKILRPETLPVMTHENIVF